MRQPWAWAILHGGKSVENRSLGAIRSGGMTRGRIALHAAQGMTRKEYLWGAHRLQEHGVRCPAPAELTRRAIIGTVTVVDIVAQSDSPWHSKSSWGLVLEDPIAIEAVPCPGALGYFAWERSGDLAPPAPWMEAFAPKSGGHDLFGDLPLGFRDTPEKPW